MMALVFIAVLAISGFLARTARFLVTVEILANHRWEKHLSLPRAHLF
jgi:hypothetical protein